MLTLTNLTVTAGGKKILKKINHVFERGKVYAIMGPNGSGKSTLAYTLMGSPVYTIESGSITMKHNNKKVRLNSLTPHERAQQGLFLSFQNPLSLQGIRVGQLLQLACAGAISAIELRKKIQALAQELHIRPDLLERSLNDGASGGERKKMEVLQAAVLNKPVQIYDEIDTGVDIDALKQIGVFLNHRRKDKVYIIITHYYRVLEHISPHEVIIMRDGNIVKTGGAQLAQHIENNGYVNV